MKRMWFIDIGYGLVSNRLSHEVDMFPSSYNCQFLTDFYPKNAT